MKKVIHLLLLMFFAIIGSCSNGNGEGTDSAANRNADKEITKDSVIVSDNRIGIKMTNVGGIYQIPCVVNGVKMNFIFDTGASNVCISMTEAMFLAKNDYLEDKDFLGRSQSQIADGSVVENMEINLHSLEIEGIMLTDVKAIVVKSLDAPLLLGQSALKKLGKIEIDGDSLFIIKKGEKKQVVKKNINQEQDSNALKLVEPKEHWYDAILAKWGYDKKIEEYLGAAWAAYKNDLPEMAYSYCDKALDLRKTAKVYGLKGYLYYEQFKNIDDGSNNSVDVAKKALECLEHYYARNKKKEDYGYLSGDTLHYDDLVLLLAYSDYDSHNRRSNRMIELGQELYLRNPNSIHVMNLLSVAYTTDGKYDLAGKWAKKILETHLDDKRAYSCLAYLSMRQGRDSEAIRYYEKCLEIDSDDKLALNNLATIYWNMSLYDNFTKEKRVGEKWDAMRAYAVSLLQKAARLGEPHAKSNLKEKGYEW